MPEKKLSLSTASICSLCSFCFLFHRPAITSQGVFAGPIRPQHGRPLGCRLVSAQSPLCRVTRLPRGDTSPHNRSLSDGQQSPQTARRIRLGDGERSGPGPGVPSVIFDDRPEPAVGGAAGAVVVVQTAVDRWQHVPAWFVDRRGGRGRCDNLAKKGEAELSNFEIQDTLLL